MSDFFEAPPPPPPEPPDVRPFPWGGPPENEVGVIVPLELELARTEAIALFVLAAVVYSTGLRLTLALRRRERPDFRGNRPPPLSFHAQQADDLRFGLQFADGSKATTGRYPRAGTEPSPPLLTLRSAGGGSARSSDAELWLWPLPPPGPLAFVVEWTEQGIDLSRREIDAQPILDAAAKVEQLWPDERPLPTAWTQVVG